MRNFERWRGLGPWLVASCGWLMLLAGMPSQAATIYVNNTAGSDRLSGRAEMPLRGDGPVRTIRVALALASFGDTISIANTGQPYREMISLSGPQHTGSPELPFVIQGNGAVLDGTVESPPGAWQHVSGDVFALQPRRLSYQQLFNGAQPLERVAASTQAEAAATLQPLQWAFAENRLLFRVEEVSVPDLYELRHAGLQTGITLYATRHVRIENLVVQGFQQDGINAHERAKAVELLDVECRANGRSGLSVGGVSQVRVERGNFYDNGRVQVRTEMLGKLELAACDVADESAPAYHHRGQRLIVDGAPMERSTASRP